MVTTEKKGRHSLEIPQSGRELPENPGNATP
jgi:hypothetical protein